MPSAVLIQRLPSSSEEHAWCSSRRVRLFRVMGDPAVAKIEADQSGNPAAEPEAAPAVGGDGSDREVDLLLPGALGRFTLGKLEQPLYRAEPQRAGWVAVDGESVVARSGERRRLSANSERPDY